MCVAGGCRDAGSHRRAGREALRVFLHGSREAAGPKIPVAETASPSDDTAGNATWIGSERIVVAAGLGPLRAQSLQGVPTFYYVVLTRCDDSLRARS